MAPKQDHNEKEVPYILFDKTFVYIVIDFNEGKQNPFLVECSFFRKKSQSMKVQLTTITRQVI